MAKETLSQQTKPFQSQESVISILIDFIPSYSSTPSQRNTFYFFLTNIALSLIEHPVRSGHILLQVNCIYNEDQVMNFDNFSFIAFGDRILFLGTHSKMLRLFMCMWTLLILSMSSFFFCVTLCRMQDIPPKIVILNIFPQVFRSFIQSFPSFLLHIRSESGVSNK